MRFWRGKYFVTVESLRFQGRTYAEGDEFPWRKRAISEASVRRLVNQGCLRPDTEDNRYKPPAPEPETTEEEITEATTEEIEAPDPEFIFDPSIHELEFPRRGHVHITQDDEVVLTITRAEGKRLRDLTVAQAVAQDEIR